MTFAAFCWNDRTIINRILNTWINPLEGRCRVQYVGNGENGNECGILDISNQHQIPLNLQDEIKRTKQRKSKKAMVETIKHMIAEEAPRNVVETTDRELEKKSIKRRERTESKEKYMKMKKARMEKMGSANFQLNDEFPEQSTPASRCYT